jgi:alkylresorcinol/alkylpyrone synthase
LQADDLSVSNIISSGLFGDGAAAVVLSGAGRGSAHAPGPKIRGAGSAFYRDTERVMGWDIVETGFKVLLSATVPDVVREHVRTDVDGFLEAQGIGHSDIRHWIVHTGGPKVLETIEKALDLPAGALDRSWRSLRETGNLSSAAVLFVLGELLDAGEAREGDYGLLMSMGPGFGSELVLLQW